MVMDNLKSIWNQLSCDSNQLELKENGDRESIFSKLEKEARLRKKFNPLLIILIILITIFLSILVAESNATFTSSMVIGITLVTLASISIAILSQFVKMPLKQFEHDKSSMMFLSTVKEKLNQSKNMFILGLLLQNLFLTAGLYFIIFHNNETANPSTLYVFLGTMMGLGGAAIGGGLAFFNTHYKSTYQMIDHFLSE